MKPRLICADVFARAPLRVVLPSVVATALFCATTASAQTPTTAASKPTSSPSAIAKAKADSARLPYTAADISFMKGMIGHHAQAIVMSKWAPTHGASSSVQTLSARIINAQTDEIVLMSQWLRDRNQEAPDPNKSGMSMAGMEHMDHNMGRSELMPGMLTDVQLRALDAARDSEFDRLFLSFMIQHHQGAIGMVKTLFNTPGAGQDEMVFKFASDVNVDQSTEVERMQDMLFNVLSTRRP